METDYEPVRAGGISLDDWARRHHGGASRHWAQPGESTSDLATKAAQNAISDAELKVDDIDLILMSTITNDYRLPQAAGMLQANLGSKAKFIQLDSACTGFVDSLLVATGLMQTQGYKTVLLVTADVLTYFNDPKKFVPLTVFGDGAGAVVLRKKEDDDFYGLRSFSTGSDGSIGNYICVPGGGSKKPFSQEVLDQRLHYWRFSFPQVNAWAVDKMVQCTSEAVAKAGLTLDDIKWFIPHQASAKIIMNAAKRLNISEDRFIINYPQVGNLSGASIPVALDEANHHNKFLDGDWLVMPAVGAGMAWAAATYRWYDYKKVRTKS